MILCSMQALKTCLLNLFYSLNTNWKALKLLKYKVVIFREEYKFDEWNLQKWLSRLKTSDRVYHSVIWPTMAGLPIIIQARQRPENRKAKETLHYFLFLRGGDEEKLPTYLRLHWILLDLSMTLFMLNWCNCCSPNWSLFHGRCHKSWGTLQAHNTKNIKALTEQMLVAVLSHLLEAPASFFFFSPIFSVSVFTPFTVVWSRAILPWPRVRHIPLGGMSSNYTRRPCNESWKLKKLSWFLLACCWEGTTMGANTHCWWVQACSLSSLLHCIPHDVHLLRWIILMMAGKHRFKLSMNSVKLIGFELGIQFEMIGDCYRVDGKYLSNSL